MLSIFEATFIVGGVKSLSPFGGSKSVDWDASEKKFVFNSTEDRNYLLQFFLNFDGGTRPVDVFYRFLVPSPTPIYFPFPEGKQYGNLTSLERTQDFGVETMTAIYASQVVRQYGLKFQLAIAQSLIVLQRPTLDDANLVIYAT